MPGIRLVVREPDKQGKQTEREVWYRLTEYHIDKDGYLQFFMLHWDDTNIVDLHLFRRDVTLLDFASAVIRAATTLDSAYNLMTAWKKMAGKAKASGVAGVALGTAGLLAEFLKTQPFSQEGYYDSSGKLVLARKINTKNRADYDPRDL